MDLTTDRDATSRLIALGAHLRVLLAAGDLSLAADALRAAAGVARTARTPLRLARLRLLWSQALRRAGRTQEGDRELRALTRMRSAMPPLLRTAIDRSARPPAAVAGRPRASVGEAADLVLSAQREEDDREALTRICEFVLRATRATRVELWTADAGPATAIVTCGAGLGTQLGARALEAGSVTGPEAVASGWEIAAPIRLGPQLVGALAVRWPADRSGAGDDNGLVNLACAVAAPRVDALLSASRHLAHTASEIPELVGISGAIADVRRAVSRAAAAPFSVLIEGESGVGKELVARAIHQLSPRRDRRFCDVNCAALPDESVRVRAVRPCPWRVHRRRERPSRTCRRGGRRARSSSTRWRICQPGRRPSCCASCSSRRSGGSGRRSAARWTSALSAPPIETSAASASRDGFDRTSCTAWT